MNPICVGPGANPSSPLTPSTPAAPAPPLPADNFEPRSTTFPNSRPAPRCCSHPRPRRPRQTQNSQPSPPPPTPAPTAAHRSPDSPCSDPPRPASTSCSCNPLPASPRRPRHPLPASRGTPFPHHKRTPASRYPRALPPAQWSCKARFASRCPSCRSPSATRTPPEHTARRRSLARCRTAEDPLPLRPHHHARPHRHHPRRSLHRHPRRPHPPRHQSPQPRPPARRSTHSTRSTTPTLHRCIPLRATPAASRVPSLTHVEVSSHRSSWHPKAPATQLASRMPPHARPRCTPVLGLRPARGRAPPNRAPPSGGLTLSTT